MNKKLGVRFLLLFIVVLLCCFVSIQRTVWQSSPVMTAQEEPQRIVASAIVDSMVDLTRVLTMQSGLIQSIDVSIGQTVKQGQLLFSLVNTEAANHVAIQKNRLAQAKSGVLLSKIELDHVQSQYARLQRVDPRAISLADRQEKERELNLRQEQIKQAKYALSIAKTNLKNAKLVLKQFSVRAPSDGIVLQINAHPNELVTQTQPIMLLGDAEKIMLRVSIDERDAAHFNPHAPAYVAHNDAPEHKIPIQFLQLEPLIITQERLNARVQEALYYCRRTDLPSLIAGQQVSAYLSMGS
jgi:multidrug efflux pump subunit AcrA (membrane-fusion protein)